jgi:hypothetical protein
MFKPHLARAAAACHHLAANNTPRIARVACLLVYASWACPVLGGEDLAVKSTVNTRTLPLYDVLEISFQHEGQYTNPFFDVAVDVRFTAPSGKQINIGGFHYGSSTGPEIRVSPRPDGHGGASRRAEYHFAKQDLWKARFAPCETGRWVYAYVFTNTHGGVAKGRGAFDCVKGRAPLHGFVRANPGNPYRWVFDDGTPYFPIGLQECVNDTAGAGSVLAAQSLEGPFRLDRKGRPNPPPGALFQPGPAMNPVNGDVYFRQYARAGFNLFRFSQQNCSLPLYTDLDRYLVQQGVMVDELLQCARKYRFRIFYGLFGYQQVFNDRPENSAGMEKLKRFVKYSVDRWGAYVDF